MPRIAAAVSALLLMSASCRTVHRETESSLEVRHAGSQVDSLGVASVSAGGESVRCLDLLSSGSSAVVDIVSSTVELDSCGRPVRIGWSRAHVSVSDSSGSSHISVSDALSYDSVSAVGLACSYDSLSSVGCSSETRDRRSFGFIYVISVSLIFISILFIFIRYVTSKH